MKTVISNAGSDLKTVVAVEDGKMITGSVQDCTAIVEETTRKRNEGEHGTSEMRHAASFPEVLVEKYCNTNGIEFSEFMQNQVHVKRMLQDPALSYFRVWEGRV